MSVRCPSCGSTVRVPGEEFTGTPPAAPPRRRDQFTDAPGYPNDEGDDFDRPHGRPGGPGLEGLSNDYSIDIGEWFRYGWAHVWAVMGAMIGYFFLYLLMIVGLVITCVGILALPILVPPLSAGFTIVGLAQLKGERWTFGDFFGGFRQFGPILGGVWLAFLLTGLWTVPGSMLQQVGQMKYQAEDNARLQARIEANKDDPIGEIARSMGEQQRLHLEDPVVLAGFVLTQIGQLVGLYFQIRCMFVMPLIVDRNCGPVECIQGSFRLTRGHFWGLLGVALLLGLINLAGIIPCGLGLLFTAPFTCMVILAGYLLIAGTRRPVAAPGGEPAY
jgi:hypothetical protein